jgi:hypothetical protein
MRIQFKTGGGIAGQRRKVTVDTDEKTVTVGTDDRTIGTDELPVGEANELERLVEVADFFELSATSAPPPGAADYQQYTISVTTPSRSHEARLMDPIETPRVRELVNDLNRLWEKMIEAHLASRRRGTS